MSVNLPAQEYWQGVLILAVKLTDNFEESRAVGMQVLIADGQNPEDFELHLVWRKKRHATAWYASLPFDARLRVVRTTIVRKSPSEAGVAWNIPYPPGDTSMQYKGVHENGWLLVFSNNTLRLWVNSADVEAV